MEFARSRYPHAEIVSLSHRELRESGWKGQIRTFRKLRGQALIFFFRSRDDLREPCLLVCMHLLHRCRETVIADEAGVVRAITLGSWLAAIPGVLAAAATDLMVFVLSGLILHLLRTRVGITGKSIRGAPAEIAYLYPYPLNREVAGGAITHMRGFLGGLADSTASCTIFSGCSFPFVLPFPVLNVPLRRRRFLFWESRVLSYNWAFTKQVRKQLGARIPSALYQRHGRFTIAGVLLSRALGHRLFLSTTARRCGSPAIGIRLGSGGGCGCARKSHFGAPLASWWLRSH